MMSGIVRTIADRCRRCYTCIRHCPAKAIKVEGGQAKVMEERCIGCGNCIRVCSQAAKEIESARETVSRLLAEDLPVIACLAPSFPVLLDGVSPGQLVAALRRLGFAEVLEVAFGAELVAQAYGRLDRDGPIITTACPALYAYVEKYMPRLLPHLAPVVSPMLALARVIKQRYRPQARVVFIGPCVAKKAEAKDPEAAGMVDAVLTFAEMKQLLDETKIVPAELAPEPFTGPRPSLGRIFPVSGGLLRTAGLERDVLDAAVVVTEGVDRVVQVLRELETGSLQARLLDLLMCEGCIGGPVAESDQSLFARKEAVCAYVRDSQGEAPALGPDLAAYADVDLSRTFTDQRISLPQPTEQEIVRVLASVNKLRKEDELNCGACGYNSCREKAAAVYQGLAEATMCLPYLIEQLEATCDQLARSKQELEMAEEQLIHSEKLASMGQLAAGVAHELNNPLGTMLIYAHLLRRSLEETDPKRADLEMIAAEAERCRSIVSGLLNFARQTKVDLAPTDLGAVLRESVAGLERHPGLEQVTFKYELDPDLPSALLDGLQLKGAFINMLRNAAEAMPQGGEITLATGREGEDRIWAKVADTGCGIPEENIGKLFAPFFTTKPIGKGTGLGLAIVYGIVKMHQGQIEVNSRPGHGSAFTVYLPLAPRQAEGG